MENLAKDVDSKRRIFVGIAASAGGLEAATELVKNLPEQANAIYVIAQHMSPTHKSLLTSLISRETALPVVELNKTDIIPDVDTIYITPPNSDVVVRAGKLHLTAPSGVTATPKPSADRLFTSMAAECGAGCVGIVLSGTGTDGSYGVQAIRESGGITISQDAASAKYEGMPTSAAATGCIDLTLTAEQIGKHLFKILNNPHDLDDLRRINSKNERASELLQILLARTRIDFRDYKETTVNRRIHRRMVALGIDDYEDYVEHCRTSETEVDALHRDLLISVTRFFRDPEQFEQLRTELVEMIRTREPGQLRVWIAGCATGEEAYSIAILLADILGGPDELEKNRVQIFATDIDDRALDIARRGIYPITAMQDIPARFLDTYFLSHGGTIEVVPQLRAITLFSKHNIFQDPPFINIDLATLRNVLIYFNQALQERVLARIHYSLRPKGLMFLGTSESVGAMELHFEGHRNADKIFEKRGVSRAQQIVINEAVTRSTPRGRQSTAKESSDMAENRSDRDQMFDALARTVAPNGFVVTRNGSIVRVFGDVSPLLQLDETSSLSLSLRILRGKLRDEASVLISLALKKNSFREGRWHDLEGPGFNQVRMICYPIIASSGEDHVLIAFQTRFEENTGEPIEALSDQERTQYILQMETEVQSTRETLQQTVEELQTSNEELQSVNEEMQSTNEEMQATNEELETSNEELQSTNEELITVNEEMQVNAVELQTVSTELTAVLRTSPFPVLVIDQALVVRRASASAAQFLGSGGIPPTGIHLSQCVFPHNFPSMTKLASRVFKERATQTIRVDNQDTISSVVFSPFNDSSGQLLGLTISLFDYDALATSKMTEVMERLGGIGSWRFDVKNKIVTLSKEARHNLQLSEPTETLTFKELERLVHPDDRQMVRNKLQRAFETSKPFNFETRVLRSENRVLYIQVSGTMIRDDIDRVVTVVGAFRDATSSIASSMVLENLEQLRGTSNFGLFSYDLENDTMFLTGDMYQILGIKAEDSDRSLETFLETFSKKDRSDVSRRIEQLCERGGTFDIPVKIAGKRGAKSNCILQVNARQRLDGTVSHLFGSVRRS